jgi:hypothetical protein
MSIDQLDQRLTAVERQLAEMQRRTVTSLPPAAFAAVVVGSMADYPEFDQVMEFVRRQREEELAAFDRGEDIH